MLKVASANVSAASQEIHVMDVQQCDAIISVWINISSKCFHEELS